MGRRNEFEGATCSACDAPLDSDGQCTDEGCGYSSCGQDEPGGWLRNQDRKRKPAALGHFEAGCVVANSRSRTYKLPADKGYARGRQATHVIFFKTEEDAKSNGYRRLGEPLKR